MEVGAALMNGRRSKTIPRWALRASSRHARRKKTGGIGPPIRYVWSHGEERVYVVRREGRDRQSGAEIWIVLTMWAATLERSTAA